MHSLNNEEQLINTCENLDWKRQFGLHLWYKCLPINSIHDALSFYEKSLTDNTCVRPLPPYLEDKVSTNLSDSIAYTSTKQNLTTTTTTTQFNSTNSAIFKSFGQNNKKKQIQKEIYDTCFHLIKLYCDENYSLADAVSPLAHNSNQLDFRLRYLFFSHCYHIIKT